MIRPWRDKTPKVDPTAFVDESAKVIGDVVIGPESSVWFNAVARGDVNYIRIGARTNIQDGSVLHVTGTPSYPLILGDDVTVGHGVTLHGCVIEGPALIGMGAIVMDGAVLRPDVVVAAGAVVTEGTVMDEGWLVMGAPAKPKRELTDEERSWIRRSSMNYVEYRLDYMEKQGG